MNIATIIGILFGVAILVAATYASTDSVEVFINLPGIAIVGGGTIASTFICYPLREVMRVLKVFMMAMGADELPLENYIKVIVGLSKQVATKGEAHLEGSLKNIENDFLREGLQMLVDGYSKEEIKEILDNRIQQYHEQEYSAAGIYRTMATLSPAFGIIGTLIGLIAMMQGMGSDIGAIGPAMATALTTTLYGALFANMFFMPIAIKVEKRIDEITLLMQVIRDGILFIKDKTPSAIVMDKLKGYLPPRKWASVKAKK
ncbi:motility protein A [Maridesulfovibrio hydrothermalis]|uniref:MotA/TolQ/ExbB proton channel n=1 Tax=Maridesulfovibrio hydrothermalis AM13 = DSM 14728 TaxID=1121451 RepID=L0R8B6_9BACT|nr:MotA/TolQ/ExbB proton channel family protein [Maridesulfovibrio hydrothermalis]CCO22989.1 MotA/TolQ/ExbB proton channel [Maridesulfovibrio hydrothermalis AM13 = DSM 14728]